MKIQIKFNIVILILFSLLFVFSCTKNASTEPNEENVEFTAYQIAGCNNGGLSKVNTSDSCFAYSFDDKLKIDFCVTGNCCPDSQRYATDYKIISDTIFVIVADTAANLCRCICNYSIHLELSGLSKDKYIFYCNFDDRIKYKEVVNK